MAAVPDDVSTRLDRVPDQHLSGLRAALAGFSTVDLARLMGVPEEAVRPTLRLAAAKLVAALDRDPPASSVPPC
jgi:DNA-directed RNA polymerase specialized sigma24 family protein